MVGGGVVNEGIVYECGNVPLGPMQLDICYGGQVACKIGKVVFKLDIWTQLTAGAGDITGGCSQVNGCFIGYVKLSIR